MKSLFDTRLDYCRKLESYGAKVHYFSTVTATDTGRNYETFTVEKDGRELSAAEIQKLRGALHLTAAEKRLDVRQTETMYRYAPEIRHALILFPLPER